jgi:hypothetical protein
VDHYHLNAILAVGFRVRSQRGTQFRQWAITRLEEYLRKGFTMDDERLKHPPSLGVPDYFDEVLERIRDIRASEKRVYLQVRNIHSGCGWWIGSIRRATISCWSTNSALPARPTPAGPASRR